MTYTPGLNGGRINLTLGGNSTSAGGGYALASTGTVLLAGGNNVTLSQNGQSITISGGAGGNQTIGASNLGNTVGTSGVATGSAVQFAFAGGNNVTLSQSINGASGTITVSAFNQTVQTQNLIDVTLAGNSTSAGGGYALASSGTLTLAGGNNITLSQNGNAVTISAFTQTVQTQNLHNLTLAGNSTSAGAGYIQVSSGTATLAGGNNITLSQNGNAITVSAFNQSNDSVGLYGVSNTTQSSSASVDIRSMSFAGAGIASVGATNGSVVISVPAGGGAGFTAGVSNIGNTAGNTGTFNNSLILAGGNNITLSQSTAAGGNTVTISAPNQTNQTLGLYALGNTTQNSSTTLDARTLSFNGLGMITAGYSNGSIQLSATQTVQTQSLIAGIYDGANSISTGTVRFTNANGVSFSINGQTLSGSVAAQSNQNMSLYALGNTTQNSSTLLNASNMSFNGLGAATLGYSNGSIQVSVPSVQTFSTWEPWPMHNTGTSVLSGATATSGSASFIPFTLPVNVQAQYLEMVLSMNLTTGGTSTFSQSGTVNYGIYSRNASTLSQITSGSWSYQVSYNNSTITVSQPTASNTAGYTYDSTTSANVNLSSGYTGLKLVQMPVSSVFTPGNYWVGLFNRASTVGFNSGILMSYYGNAYSITGMAPIGSLSSANTTGTNLYAGTRNWMQAFGVFTSAAQTNLPSTVDISALSQNVAVIPYMKLIAT